MELRQIAEHAEEHAREGSGPLGTRTIARWIADIAKALTTPIIVQESQPYRGHIEGTTPGDQGGEFMSALRAGMVNHEVIERVRKELEHANRRISQLVAESAAETRRHCTTTAALEKFTSACADQSIQIMELRGEVSRLQGHHDAMNPAQTVANLEAKCKRIEATAWDGQRRINEHMEAAASFQRQIDRLRDVVLNGKALTLEALITEAIDEIHAPCPDCKGMQEQLEDRGEQLRVADGDRVPLAMDLEIAQAALKEAKEHGKRLEPVLVAAQKWQGLWRPQKLNEPCTSPLIAAGCELSEAVGECEKACSQAANVEDEIAF